jgi:hypothetical protein
MTSFLPQPPGPLPGGPDRHELVDPRHRRETRQARWSLQAARWQAVALAQEIFGTGVESRLVGTPGRDGLQGLLHLAVPFRDLDEHRGREATFVRAAGADPVLSGVPLVFIFEPREWAASPAGYSGEGGAS